MSRVESVGHRASPLNKTEYKNKNMECNHEEQNEDTDVLTNLCFADDETLVTEDAADLPIMIEDMIHALGRAGWKLYLKKCVWM